MLAPRQSFCFLKFPCESRSSRLSVGCAEGGELFVWGGGSEGQLGLADQSQANTPTLLPADSRISYVSCGYYHTAYVTGETALPHGVRNR